MAEALMSDKAVGVVPVHITPQGERLFLLVRHAAGHWGFPKGHADRGETEKETALRELLEETGISEDVVELFPNVHIFEKYIFEKQGNRYDKTVKFFFGLVTDTKTGTMSGFQDEIPETKWCTYDDAHERITFPAGRRVLEKAAQYLDGNTSAETNREYAHRTAHTKIE